jgi:hypothetical protein
MGVRRLVGLGDRDATFLGDAPVLLHDAQRVEGRRERGPRVDRRDDAHDLGEHRPQFHVALGERFPGHPDRDQTPEFGQVGDDLGSHPRGRGGERRLVLGRAVDPEQRGVLVRESEEERPRTHLDAVVAVGPARLDGGDFRLVPSPFRHGRDHRVELGIGAHCARR